MLSYRHAFHAGNFADVLKHIVLMRLIVYLRQKDKPICYIDTHAGPGGYALDSDYAQKNREFDTGIGRLWQRDDAPACVAEYLTLVQQFNRSARLTRYPGSPQIALQLLRPHDRLICCELHPTEHLALNKAAQRDRRMTVHAADGLTHAPGLLPPHERRGLVLIDPSYEIKHDYRSVPEALSKMYRRFATGLYAIWYPVIERRRSQAMMRAMQTGGINNAQVFELAVKADATGLGMTACGMIVVNPPWTLAAEMQQTLPWLAEVLGQDGAGSYRIETWGAG